MYILSVLIQLTLFRPHTELLNLLNRLIIAWIILAFDVSYGLGNCLGTLLYDHDVIPETLKVTITPIKKPRRKVDLNQIPER